MKRNIVMFAVVVLAILAIVTIIWTASCIRTSGEFLEQTDRFIERYEQ